MGPTMRRLVWVQRPLNRVSREGLSAEMALSVLTGAGGSHSQW